MRDWEASSPGSNPLSPTLAFPGLSLLQAGDLLGQFLFWRCSRLSWTGSATESSESKFGSEEKERRLGAGKLGSRETAIIP